MSIPKNINEQHGNSGKSHIETQKVEFKAQSKIGSLENVKHKPGGGKVEIFNDKAYLKQIDEKSPGTPTQNEGDDETAADQLADENLNKES